MGRLKILFALVGGLTLSSTQAQDFNLIPAEDSMQHLVLIKEMKGEYTGFTVDPLGNIFLVNSSNQIRKFDSDFNNVAFYDAGEQYGDICSVDAVNPLKILVYYRDFATVVVLDRLLNLRNVLTLRDRNILQVKVITRSYDNNYWLFDEWDSRIKKVDENGKVLLESPDFRVLLKQVPDPSYISDRNGFLYLYDSHYGWLVFDYYGVLKKSYDFTGWKDPLVSGENLTGRNEVYFYSAGTEQTRLIKIRMDTALQNAVKVMNQSGYWYILHNNCLNIYQAY